MASGGRVIRKRRGGRKRRLRPDSDSDQEYVAGEDESESSDESLVSSPDDDESFELDESGDGEEAALAAAARSKPGRGRPKKSRARVSDEDNEVELEPAPAPRKRAATRSRRRRRPSTSEEDEDFNPDEDDDDDEEVRMVPDRKSSCGRKRAPRGRTKKGNLRVLKREEAVVRKRRRGRAPSSDDDDDDDDFVVKDRVALDKMRKNNLKPQKRTGVRKKRSTAMDSEEDDVDFVVSDDEEEEERKRKKKRKTVKSRKPRSDPKKKRSYMEESESEFDLFDLHEEVREVSNSIVNVKKPAGPARRKRRSMVDSESSDSDSDSDYKISESELRDLRIGGVLDQRQPERFCYRRQSEGKGKEKENEDPGKQVCGICLSEEQKGTIRGVLDSCAHYFCFACIMEWSKVESRCPMCKQRFLSIRKSAKLDPGFGLRTAVIRVPKRDQVYQPSEEEMRGLIDPYENVVCIVCQQGGDDNVMLLCDICDSSAHTYCVGLDREVPEGNWYCEACRSVDDGPSYIQAQDSVNEQGGTSSRFSFGRRTEDVAINTQSSSAQLPVAGRFFSQGFDLNVSPRDNLGEDSFTASQASGSGPSTLSGRRAIHQRIRFILSSNANRVRQMFLSTRTPHGNLEMESNGLAVESGVQARNFASDGLNHTWSSQPVAHSDLNLSRCMFNQGHGFRHVDGAKERVQSMVKDHLKKFSKDIPLDHDSYKDIARRCTHTILAACGIEHRRNKVVGPVEQPNICPHDFLYDESADLVKSCCSSCFSSFAEDVVLRVMRTTVF